MPFRFNAIPNAKDLMELANYLTADAGQVRVNKFLEPIKVQVAASLREMAVASADCAGELTEEARRRYHALRLFVLE